MAFAFVTQHYSYFYIQKKGIHYSVGGILNVTESLHRDSGIPWTNYVKFRANSDGISINMELILSIAKTYKMKYRIL